MCDSDSDPLHLIHVHIQLFWMWTIFKVFVESVTILLLFSLLIFLDLRHVGSWVPVEDGACTLWLERRSLNHWATREVPQLLIKAFSSWLWQRLKGEECFSGLLCCYSVLTACWLPAKEDGCLSCHYRTGWRRPHCPRGKTGGSKGCLQAGAQRFAVTVLPSVCDPQTLAFSKWGLRATNKCIT